MFLAILETDHFTFQALGADKDAAKRAILRGWKKHQKEYKFKAERNTIEALDEWYGINVHAIEMNECLRDGEILGVK